MDPVARSSRVGRYEIQGEIAAGGMATVHLGRMHGERGFSRPVAIKRMHPHLARDPQFSSMFVDEARLSACVRHPNVVPVLDVVSGPDDLLLVLEYVEGASLSEVLRALPTGSALPVAVAVAIALDVLGGLHAAHEAVSESGAPLGLVHRDVSPANVLLGIDGVARLTDFGVAKAAGRVHTTRDGAVKGKAAYMAPEQLRGKRVDRRTDVYAASIVLWEMLAGERLFAGETPEESMTKILEAVVAPPSTLRDEVPSALDDIVLRGLARDPEKRWPSAAAMESAIASALTPASRREVGAVVQALASPLIERRRALRSGIEDGAPATGGNGVLARSSPATTLAEPLERSRRRLAIGLAAGAVVVTAVTIAAIPVFRPPAPVTVAGDAELATASAVALPAFATASTGLADASPPEALSLPASSAESRAASAKRPPVRVSPIRKDKSTVKPTPGCEPPYRIDSTGVRVPKPECL